MGGDILMKENKTTFRTLFYVLYLLALLAYFLLEHALLQGVILLAIGGLSIYFSQNSFYEKFLSDERTTRELTIMKYSQYADRIIGILIIIFGCYLLFGHFS